MAKKMDILARKRAALEQSVTNYDNAISLVTNTISNLSNLSKAIENQIVEIDTYVADLAATKSGLIAIRDQNNRVAQNFAKLLCASEETNTSNSKEVD